MPRFSATGNLSITHNSCAPENESQRDPGTKPRVAATLEQLRQRAGRSSESIRSTLGFKPTFDCKVGRVQVKPNCAPRGSTNTATTSMPSARALRTVLGTLSPSMARESVATACWWARAWRCNSTSASRPTFKLRRPDRPDELRLPQRQRRHAAGVLSHCWSRLRPASSGSRPKPLAPLLLRGVPL